MADKKVIKGGIDLSKELHKNKPKPQQDIESILPQGSSSEIEWTLKEILKMVKQNTEQLDRLNRILTIKTDSKQTIYPHSLNNLI